MSAVRVFVSRSFGQDHVLLDALAREPGGEFDLGIDQDQNLPGWEWRPKVHAGLAEARMRILVAGGGNRGTPLASADQEPPQALA